VEALLYAFLYDLFSRGLKNILCSFPFVPETSYDSVADPSISPEASSCWSESPIGAVEGAVLDTQKKVCCAQGCTIMPDMQETESRYKRNIGT